jgi:hypothetical protein
MAAPSADSRAVTLSRFFTFSISGAILLVSVPAG